MRKLWISKQSPILQSWCRTWPPNGVNVISVQKKNISGDTKELAKVSRAVGGSRKSLTLTIPWTFGKACEDLSWNHCTSTPHSSETNGIAKRAVCRIKEEYVCCIVAIRSWMKIGGLVLWNVTPIYEMSTDLLSEGKTHRTKGEFGQPCIGPGYSVWFTGWVLPYLCERRSRTIHQFGPESLALYCSLDMCCPRGESGKETRTGRRHWGELEDDGCIWTPRPKRLSAKEVIISQSKMKNSYFPVADGTVINLSGRRSGSENMDKGEEQDNLRGESDGLSSPTPHLDDSTLDDAEAKNDFWSILGDLICRHHVEPESNCTCREQNHCLFRWSTSTFPEQHIRHWMCCWRNRLKITGTWMERKNCQMHGQDSLSLLF